jgi:peptidoglycan hydrolase-like protein with peptidoglycan-binding domain
LHAGSQGPEVLALQQKLNSLTYMTGGADGQFGGGTRDGLIAFQKTSGLRRTGELDPPTQAALATASAPQPAYTTPAEHLEVDIAKQVVYVVRGGAVEDTLPTSTGSGQLFTEKGVRGTQRAITPNGVFNVYWKIPGWHQAPLGNLYKPDFFNGGIAFHGYNSVPTYPASHGCVRLPMEFADWFYDHAAPYGETVYVFGGPNGPNPDPVPETSMATNAPEASPGSTPAGSPSPTPSASPPPGCLNGLLGLPCPVPTPTPTPTPSPTPVLTPTGTATAPPTTTATP